MNLQLDFTIEGEKQLLVRLRDVKESMKNWRPEFKRTGQMLLKTFQENFATQGATLGVNWQRLKPSTVRQKVRLGFAGAGPLVRTGEMKRSFRSRPGKTEVLISNPTRHFKYHQSNKPRSKLPRRVMMKIDQKRRQEIIKIFQNAVKDKLKER